MAKFRKAITAAITALAGALGAAAIAGTVDLKALVACLGTGLVAGAGVYAVPNALPSAGTNGGGQS